MLKTKQIPQCFIKCIWALSSTAWTNGELNQINYVRDIFFTASFPLWLRRERDIFLASVPHQSWRHRNATRVTTAAEKNTYVPVVHCNDPTQAVTRQELLKKKKTLYIYYLLFISWCLSWKLGKWSSSIQILHAFSIPLAP